MCMRKHELSSLIIVPKLRVLRPVEDVKVLNRVLSQCCIHGNILSLPTFRASGRRSKLPDGLTFVQQRYGSGDDFRSRSDD